MFIIGGVKNTSYCASASGKSYITLYTILSKKSRQYLDIADIMRFFCCFDDFLTAESHNYVSGGKLTHRIRVIIASFCAKRKR